MISLLIPTRGRPDNIKRLHQSALETADKPEEVEFSFYVDDDDTDSIKTIKKLSGNIKLTVGPRIILSQMWNEAYKKATGPIYQHCGDDIVFRTKHWDTKVKEVFEHYPDKVVFVCCNDGYQKPDNGGVGTHGFIHKNWVDTVGYFVPPYFSSDYNDMWLDEVAKKLRRHVYLDKVLIEHMHFINGKGELDKTHQERIERGVRDNVEQVWNDKVKARDGDVEKLRVFVRNFYYNTQGQLNPPTESKYVLSVLICSVLDRRYVFHRLASELTKQIVRDNLSNDVEVLVALDDFEMTISEKRNLLLKSASGKFIVFVDDDDMVRRDFLRRIVRTIKKHPEIDYIGYKIKYFNGGTFTKPTFHSLKYEKVHEDDGGWYRPVAHINPIKREKAVQFSFPVVPISEDIAWDDAIHASGVLKKEVFIPKFMYIYTHIPGLSLSWGRHEENIKHIKETPVGNEYHVVLPKTNVRMVCGYKYNWLPSTVVSPNENICLATN